jgi:hypothetical protein
MRSQEEIEIPLRALIKLKWEQEKTKDYQQGYIDALAWCLGGK